MNYKLLTTNYKLKIAWLYPELMSTYGDRGNVIVLQKIAESNGIEVEIMRIDQNLNSQISNLKSADLIFMGGAQDLQQEIVNKDLLENKGTILKQMIEDGTPGLYICGAFQFLGKYYKDAYGTKIEGLGVFDMYTESYKNKPRLIGNCVIEPKFSILNSQISNLMVGFENHGGRTFLSDKSQAFATVKKGFGNNGKDKTEGIHYKNSIGTYLHGPILPSNPELAVYLLEVAYENKYGEKIDIKFNDVLSKKARLILLKRFGINSNE